MVGLALLGMAHSSTSLACFLLGSGVMLAAHLRAIRRRPSRVHLLCLAVALVGVFGMVFEGTGGIANTLGRESTFSGRTEIWAALISAASNPIIGAGFESFWNSPNVLIFQRTLNLAHWYRPERYNEAHNGYLEVYVNLGWLGVCLIVLILATGYSRACKTFGRDRELGSLMLAYVICGAIYSITEAGFRTLNAMWIFMLLAVVSVSGVDGRLFGNRSPNRSRARMGRQVPEADWEAGAVGLEGRL